MKVTSNSKSYLVVDDFFNEREQKQIWKELEFLTDPSKLLPPEKTGTAFINDELLKKNQAIFLDTFYGKREHSNILNNCMKMLSREMLSIFDDMDGEFKYAIGSNLDTTLLSYYEDTDYYKPHTDEAVLTFLYWCYKEPKAFEGGDLILPEIDADIEVKNNRLVVFPSYRLHSVTPLSMNIKNEPFSTFGRYCITKFLFVTPSKAR
jgi:hypothetical protein